MLKTQTNIPMTAHQEPTAEEINQAWEEESDLMEGPITPGEIDQMENRIAQSRALAVVDEAPMSLDVFQRLKAKAAIYTSYTGAKPVSLEDFYNRTVTIRGFIIQDLENINEESGEATRWQELRLKLEDNTVIAASGKGAKGFARMLMDMGFPQGDWPASVQVAVSRRKLNGTTTDGAPKYMPTFQIVG